MAGLPGSWVLVTVASYSGSSPHARSTLHDEEDGDVVSHTTITMYYLRATLHQGRTQQYQIEEHRPADAEPTTQ